MNSALAFTAKWLIALFVLGTAAGCSGGGEPGNNAAEKILLPVTRISLAVPSSAKDKEIENQIALFNADHPDWIVDLIKLPRDKYDESLNMLMTSGEGPDVFQLNTGWLSTYMYKNWLLDLSMIEGEPTRSAFPEWAIEYTKQSTHYYAIPSAMNTLRLIYNKDLLGSSGCDQHPPATLSEMKSCAVKVSLAGTGYRKYGFALPAGDDDAGFRRPLEIANTLSGAYYYDFRKGSYDFSVYEPWFRTMLEMKSEGGLFPGEVSLKNDTALTQFAEGNIGMMYVTNHDFAQLSRMNRMKFSWGVSMPPLLDASRNGKGALMIDPEPPFVINSFTGRKDEAVLLWQYLHSGSYLGTMYEQGDLITTRPDITGDRQYKPTLPGLNAFLPSITESPYPKEPRFVLANPKTTFGPVDWGDEARMKTYRDILQGIKTPEEALSELTAQSNVSLEMAIYNNIIGKYEYVIPSFDPLIPLKNANNKDDVGGPKFGQQ